MKSILQQISEKFRAQEKEDTAAIQAEISNPATSNDRRNFLKKTALGGIALGGFMGMSLEDTLAQTTSKVSRASSPADLKITDMRYAVAFIKNEPAAKGSTSGQCAIIRIDTNQGIYGLGEVRDGADVRYALMLKSRLLGQNPCNVEQIFKSVKQFGGHGRAAGGVCGVEMALWDLCGKAYGVPAWQLLGGRYRDKVRLYADTPESTDVSEMKEKVRVRLEDQGFTWLKMDLSIRSLQNIKGATVNTGFWNAGTASQFNDPSITSYANTLHPFTQIQITDKGLEHMASVVENVRSVIGYEVPLSSDHYGHFDVNTSIRLGRAVEKYRLAWLEDMVPWFYTDQWITVTQALETPTITGEDIFLKEEFKKLVDKQAVDLIHPDLASSGGLLETKRIGDYAEEGGVAMAMHFAGTPVSFMANVHCAAATQNFLALEHHSPDVPFWESLVKTTDGRKLYEKGFAKVPDMAPGLGVELNEEVFKQHLHLADRSYFRPTPEWDEKRSHDRLWS
ncbi:secreted protein [Pontibacter ummariensis]|uniref:Tat (Twin-arginine translocation) pathway signal sequence n=1 Tax=Pontibacter ummariensis TaxID=1610492 RepID=A0A239B8H8_9BACT|nr:mandelate racemase/muconate lactonizing enzyme family protein [Pontibacter ummariensis]PRY16374.1 secreted protein [Pontibacter ummariensis]SNS04049.1 Tat (twin-arginine translocation) pathway signal sequence [Pontibacter ummariensis]